MAGWMAEHRKARMICPQGPCEVCSAPDAEVHHKNEDWKDHRPENLQRLCRSCHMKVHRSGKKCMLCDSPHKGLGYCDMHYQRFKKWGDPTAVKDNQFTPVRKDCDQNPQKGCQVLDCTAKHHARGYCSKHAQQERRGTLKQPQTTNSEASMALWR